MFIQQNIVKAPEIFRSLFFGKFAYCSHLQACPSPIKTSKLITIENQLNIFYMSGKLS